MNQKHRVLIVEDEIVVAIFLEDLLADFGYHVAGVVSHLDDALTREIDQRQAQSNADNAPKAVDKSPAPTPTKQTQSQAPAKQAAKQDDSDSDTPRPADAGPDICDAAH